MRVPRQDIFALLQDAGSPKPKFERIVEATREAVRFGRLGIGDALPSINAMSARYGVARETVRKSYDILRKMGLATSRRGKGFSIASQRVDAELSVFVLFDTLTSAYKEEMYEALRKRLGRRVVLDCYAHHFQPKLFASLLREARGTHHFHIVIPLRHPEAYRALAEMDQQKLLVLDVDIDFPGGKCHRVVQSHDEGLVEALEVGLERIRRYDRLVLVFPGPEHHHPPVIRKAFLRFCRRHSLPGSVISKAKLETVQAGSAYLVIEDNDLVALVKGCAVKGLTLGRDVGIISYNETPLKEIVAGGVTVVSVDFHELGLRAAETVLGLNRESVRLSTRFIARATL